ncbi:IS256 family transposase [uncultured Allobaculum sp.]|uniref:IS256 family transposase n=1 Tax=uncultured Allobaculum sp. TaxID=1187017 RepID=UPI0025894939|nr:IS256 family transposase [uncultured Allobaculum sp.]
MPRKAKAAPTVQEQIASTIIKEYQPQSFQEASDIIKSIFGPVLEQMFQGELDSHLGYTSGSHAKKTTENRRNGYSEKTVKSSQGELDLRVPRDRLGTFEPQAVPKGSRDISDIENKILRMYGQGMSQRDISAIIQDIYGFSVSADTISNITDRVYPVVDEWRNRPLKQCYPFVFVDCLYVSVKTERGAKEQAVYVVLGYDTEGHKDILGIWIGESESKHFWMQIFDELKIRGVEDIFFLSMDGVRGLEGGAKAVFPNVIVQWCIVHLLRNSLKYIPAKERASFCKDIKKVYSALNAKEAEAAFEEFKEKWSGFHGAVNVWERNFHHVLQLFNYGSAVRKIMYTTNAIESVNSSLRKVTKKGSFPSEDSVYKALYLRIVELEKKWRGRTVPNWSIVRNQLLCEEGLSARLEKYSAK